MHRSTHSRASRALLAASLVGAFGLLVTWVALAAEPRTVALVSTGPASTDGQGEPYFGDLSDDGSRVFFETDEQLVAADTDAAYDAYERSGGTTRLLSIGPDGGNGEEHSSVPVASADGTSVFFTSQESLLAEDDDGEADVYRREGDELTLVSTGASGNAVEHVELNHVSADGSRAYFGTEGALVPTDEDAFWDVYVYESGVTSLATPGVTAGHVELTGITEDGSVLFLRTYVSLDGADSDETYDVYSLSGGSYELHSLGPDGGNAPFAFANLQGFSEDGSRVFFTTPESLVAADTDEHSDVYESFSGVVSLVSFGPTGGNGPEQVQFGGSSADGTRVLFSTDEALVAADVNDRYDVYERSAGATSLVSPGSAGTGVGGVKALSSDAGRVLIDSDYQLSEADGDDASDVYELSGGTATLLSSGTEGGDAYFLAASEDLSRVFFETIAPADPGDDDGLGTDVYEAHGGEVVARSQPPGGSSAAEDADFDAISPDGRFLVFNTEEALLAADPDEEKDLYLSGPPQPDPPAPPDPKADPPAAVPELPLAPAAKPRCAGKPATIVGSARRDVLKGTGKRDVIFAGAGNDKVLGRGGNDLVCAGGGKDTVLGGGGDDTLLGQGGPDRLFGGAGRDAIRGGGGRDLCRAQGGKRGPVRQCER